MQVFGLAGWSGSGKTTLLVKLIPRLKAHGLTVSTVKHAHHSFDIDQPGKDSHRHREAGATEVLIGSAKRWALIHELHDAAEPSLADLLARLPIHEGDTVADDTLEQVKAVAQKADEHINVGYGLMASGEARIILSLPGASTAPAPANGAKRITIGGNVQQAKLVSQTRPTYPPDAKAARIQGVVQLSAIIGKDGSVTNLIVISGHPLLIQSAMDAVRTWTYQITLLNGEPVEVQTQIDVNYTLSQ